MFATGAHEFVSNTEDLQIAFQVNADGRVTSLMMRQDGKETLALPQPPGD